MIVNRILFAALALSAAGCNAGRSNEQSGELVERTDCRAAVVAAESLPADVLVGTDVVPFDSFSAAASNFGKYSSEQGGAELTVELENGPGVAATRSFVEPGLPADTRSYTELCLDEGLVYGESVRAKFVEGGIVWLEIEPGNDFIPDGLWMFLEGPSGASR